MEIKKLNDIEEILNRPKRRVKYASLLNLQPEITDNNRTERLHLKIRRKKNKRKTKILSSIVLKV